MLTTVDEIPEGQVIWLETSVDDPGQTTANPQKETNRIFRNFPIMIPPQNIG
jgi:hypothetical protein